MIVVLTAELLQHHLQQFVPHDMWLPTCAAWQQSRLLYDRHLPVDRTYPLQTDKRFQLADWRVRPLSPQMLQYARMDTHYLLHMYDVCKVSW